MSTSSVMNRTGTAQARRGQAGVLPSPPAATASARVRAVGSVGDGGSAGLRPGLQRGTGVDAAVRRRSVAAASRSRLRLAPFVVLVCTLLAAGLISLLLINTALAQDAFVIQKLQTEQARHAERESALGEQLSGLNAPQNVAREAQKSGLVPSTNAPCFAKPGQQWTCADQAGQSQPRSQSAPASTATPAANGQEAAPASTP